MTISHKTTMRKTTKKQARECYDRFFGVLRNLNSGTVQENARMAKACYVQLKEVAREAEILVANPSKLLTEDEWIMESLKGSIPRSLVAFRKRHANDIDITEEV